MSYFYPAKEQKGFRQVIPVGEKTAYTGFGLLNLAAGESYGAETKEEEVALVLLAGKCRITVNGQTFDNLSRKDVFAEKATAVYAPKSSRWEVTAISPKLEVAVLSAPAERQFAPFVIRPEDVIFNHRGVLNWQRDVYDIMVANVEGKVDRIVVGETYSFPGQWSSYPSHKHDTQNLPYECQMDEIYYFKVKPTEGFGVQIMYNDDLTLREAYMIKDGDAVALPAGYHPVAAAPGFQVYYLWVMAGPHGRQLTPNDDPKLKWLQNIPAMLK
ncbi:Myo-inositol catabolism IolB domain protein [Thermosinus carboxydivorans Nor1]|uniref:Myo-inositol catabolism IolB domain protein n=1 Tax=Thermosinus carboxydivorans Nor1 TaxID=401526 RepID=A1HM17_9FIRM|nr:5-deoxy-glucuronate isomerase [Thermosinus carboxydivorans]EAX48868.1 Myo-inositol catabolism IolB domain protein [Thermosinus carboxydivorans Nor1]